jgi:hypothetical protein
MSYTVQNPNVFTAAFSGALAGMGVSGRIITNSAPSRYDGLVKLANAYAQEMDTLWGATAVASLEVETIQAASEALWQQRAPVVTVLSVIPGFYQQECAAIIAIVQRGLTLYSSEGYPNPSSGGGTDELVKVNAFDTAAGTLSQKLVGGAGVSFTAVDMGAGYLALQADATGLVQSSFANPTQTHQYLSGPGHAGEAMLKSPGVPLLAPINVNNNDLIRVSWAVGGDLTGPNPGDVSVCPYVDTLATIIAGANTWYGGAPGRINLSGVVSFFWTGPMTTISIGLALRLVGGSDLLVFNTQIQAPPCNLVVDVYRGVQVVQGPLNPIIAPP